MGRLDAILVELKLAPSRTKAQRLIESGEVEVLGVTGEWRQILQPSFQTEPNPQKIRVNPHAELLKYVSRGGLKLEGALEKTGLDPRGQKCLDIGLSTGGFSDCLLQRGAAEVIGIDVGHDQLAKKLRSDSRLKQFEGVNVRELPPVAREAAVGVTLCVVDVSFISVQLVIPILQQILATGAHLLLLVKPQFEVGAANLDKGGVVRDETLFEGVLVQVLLALEKCGFSNLDRFPSVVKGQDGNQEFFVHALRI